MAHELAVGYVSLTVDTKGMGKTIHDQFGEAQRGADKAGQGIGSRLASGMGKALKVGGLAAGAAAGAAIGTTLWKGMGRLEGIDQAEAKLAGLGHSAGEVGAIMEDALTAVRGTAFGLDEAATIAASAVAAGIEPGQDLERTLTLTGDAAAIAGTELSEMGSIVNKVATADMMQMDVANQMMDAGIPILQLVAEEMGVTAEEARKMASAGEVSFETFQNALEEGLGGSALAMGDTFSGALANMGAAAARFGAETLRPLFERSTDVFGGLTDMIDDATESVKPLAAAFGDWLDDAGPKMLDFGRSAATAFQEFYRSDEVQANLSRMRSVFFDLVDTAKALAPSIGAIAKSLADAGAAVGISAWQVLLSALESVARIADVTLVPALRTLASLMENNQTLVNGLALAFAAFKTVPAIMGRVMTAVRPIGSLAKTAATGVGRVATATGTVANMAGYGSVQMGRFGSAIHGIGTHVPVIGRMQGSFLDAAGGADRFGRMAGVAAAGMEGARSAGVGLMNLVGGPLNAALIVGVTAFAGYSSAAGKAKQMQDEMAKSTREAVEAQGRLRTAMVEDSVGLSAVGSAYEEVGSQVANVVDTFESNMGKQSSGLEKFGLAVAESVPIVSWFTRGTVEQANAANSLGIESEKAAEAITDLGMTTEEMSAAVYGSEYQWDSLRSQLLATGEGGEAAARELGKVRSGLTDLREAQALASPGAFEFAASMRELADVTSTAADKAGALMRALQALGIVETDAEAAMFQAAESIDQVATSAAEAVDATGGFGDALLNEFGKLDYTQENARGLRDELSTLGSEMVTVKAAGGDVTAVWEQMSPVLGDLANKYGLTRDQVEAVAASLGVIPPETLALISVEGDAARTEIGAVALALQEAHTEGGEPIILEVHNENARRALREVGIEYEVVDESLGLIEIQADNATAIAMIGHVARGLGELDATDATPFIGGDATNLFNITGNALVELGVLDNWESIAAISGDATKFRSEDAEVHAMLETIDRAYVAPEVDAVIDKFLNGRDVTMAELANIDRQEAKPEVIAIIDEAVRRARMVSNELDIAARNRTAMISVVEQRYGSTAARLLERASGGPVFGAGTATSDSIPALLSNGEHVWTAKEVAALGGHDAVYRMRAAVLSGELPGYAQGGGVGAALAAARSKEGLPYVWGGTGPGGFDCSGFVGFLHQIVMGVSEAEAAGKRLYTTYSLIGGAHAGLIPGDNPSSMFRVGVNQDHMAATLAGHNVESGGASTPSSSGIGPGRAGVDHSQWTHRFHLPASLTVGGGDGDSIDNYSIDKPMWSDDDEQNLQRSRTNLQQAIEARDRAYEEGKSELDKQAADLRVQRAELDVRELESKRDGGGGASSMLVAAAPPIEGVMDDDAIRMRQAEISVLDAQLSRDQTYSDPTSTTLDKEKADLSLFSAQNALLKAQEDAAAAADPLAEQGGLRGVFTNFAANAAGAAYDAAWEILGIPEPRYTSIAFPQPQRPGQPAESMSVQDALTDVPSHFPHADIMGQLPVSQPDMADWLRRHGIALHDEGGWLEPGLTLNLTKKPEAVLNPEQLKALYAVAEAGMPGAPQQGGRASTVINNNQQFMDKREMQRDINRQASKALVRGGMGF